MNYCELKLNDVANGPGIRVSLFVSGCTHRCPGCFNAISWDFDAGEPFTEATQKIIIDAMAPSYISGLTLLGGEPMEHSNQQGLLPFLKKIKEIYPQKNIWCFTGYLFDKDICDRMCKEWPETLQLLSLIDIIVDGEYMQDKRNLSLKFKGSENQRTIDVAASLTEGKVIEIF